jgi:predicted nucleic acid-binding protein
LSYLLDTNVISETRKRRPEPKVVRWLESSAPDALYVSVLTLGEIAKGIELQRRRDRLAAAALEEWLRGLGERFTDHIIPVDQEIANCWGRLSTDAHLPVVDGLLAATAVVRGLALVTRNTGDVARTGAPIVNPWD